MTVIEPETRLRAARGVAKTEADGAVLAFTTLQQRGHPDAPPPLASDGWASYREALLEVWGRVPPYRGRGRPPTRKQPGADWQYLQIVKTGDAEPGLAGRLEVVYGDPQTVPARVGTHTNHIERTHLTMRHSNGRLGRQTLGFAKDLAMLQAACAWEDLVYNLARPVKTLRQALDQGPRRWQPRTPMMAAGLTEHVWTIKEILTTVPLPRVVNT